MLQRKLTLIALLVATPCIAENIPYDQAKEAGVVKCLPAVQKVSQFLHDGKNHGAHSSWGTANPDKQMFTSTIERTYSDGAHMSSIFVAPLSTGACATAYERVAYWDKSCLALAKDTFSDFEYKGELNKFVTILSKKSGGGSVYLMAAGTGCVSVRKETIQDGNNP
jgi:hypothetical protein